MHWELICKLSNTQSMSSTTMPVTKWKQIQQNSVKPNHTGPHRCQIIEYSGLWVGTYND